MKPNCVWVGYITYVWTSEGWLYIAVVIDLYSRRVVGAIGKRMSKQLVMDALIKAVWRRKPFSGLIFYSDRGANTAAMIIRNYSRGTGLVSSMSRKGDCWDNAVAESFFGTFKTEQIQGGRDITRDQAKGNIVDYIEMFYNSKRLHSYLGYMSLMEWEENRLLQKAA